MLEKCQAPSGERSGGRKADSRTEKGHSSPVDESQQNSGLIRVGDYPPGVELEERQFITDPCLHTVGGDELGGAQFISEIAPSLADEFLPALPQIAPLIRRRGPRVLLPETVEEFCRLLSVGLSRRQAAARLDIDHSTISKAAKEDPELAALIQRAEEIAAGDPFLCLIAASRKSWRAALSLMQHRRQFREPTPVEDRDEKMRERKVSAPAELVSPERRFENQKNRQ